MTSLRFSEVIDLIQNKYQTDLAKFYAHKINHAITKYKDFEQINLVRKKDNLFFDLQCHKSNTSVAFFIGEKRNFLICTWDEAFFIDCHINFLLAPLSAVTFIDCNVLFNITNKK